MTFSLMLASWVQERAAVVPEATLSLEDIASPEAKSNAPAPRGDGRIILDDVDWGIISEKHGTRSPLQCLEKWYQQLAPSMVARGVHLL